ncbi:hypothetical protein LWI28_017484 [Acer negundo]|uniref:Uncharacterized protein n=1 Tax=Acer negundo TaxID=4023 RepID=A0AAD5JEN5_ACENE|nr:hypothetical protein LWI28_017484 [Acer negundo]
MLPTSMSKGRSSSSNSRANPMFPQYLRRIIKWQQLDIEYTFWQMLHLCTSPKVVYQHTKYHKLLVSKDMFLAWFLSSDSPFNRKGFSIVMHDDPCASLACSILRKGQNNDKEEDPPSLSAHEYMITYCSRLV